MTKNHFQIAICAAILCAVAALIVGFGFASTAKAEADSMKCSVSTVTAVAIGNQASTQVLATSTRARAFAMIQQVRDASGIATSTVSISLENGYNATLGNGIQLSTSTPSLTFGLNTLFPYEGAVQAITNVGSTTLRVTECVY